MFCQLGNIQFEPITSPESLSRTDTTTYAKHSLASGKPRLQPIANELEEISIGFKLRAEFCNPTQIVLQLKSAKDLFEVMPLIMGNGRYFGDYVITSLTETPAQCLPDGTIVEMTIQLTLQEFVTPDKIAQQQQAARKRAFAIGSKTPVNTGRIQQPTIPQQAVKCVSVINSESKAIDLQAINFENNTRQRTFIGTDIQRSLESISKNLASYNDFVSQLNDIVPDPDSILQAISGMQNAVSNFNFPISGLDDLRTNNLKLQSATNILKTANSAITYQVLIRRA